MNSELIVLLSTISTGILALIGLCLRYMYLSKCPRVKLCCVEFERNVEVEIRSNESRINVLPENQSMRHVSP